MGIVALEVGISFQTRNFDRGARFFSLMSIYVNGNKASVIFNMPGIFLYHKYLSLCGLIVGYN